MEMKKCSTCNETKPVSEFSLARLEKDGLQYQCKDCNKAYRIANRCKIKKQKAEHYAANREYILKQKAEYREANREKLAKGQAKYYAANREEVNKRGAEYGRNHRRQITEHERNRKANDIQYRLACNLRSRLRRAISGNYKSGSAVSDLGCSIAALKEHLEKQFQPGMSWDNYGDWHIDHIKPLSSFNLEDREQLLVACNYTNLQPLWAADNIRKGNKILEEIWK